MGPRLCPFSTAQGLFWRLGCRSWRWNTGCQDLLRGVSGKRLTAEDAKGSRRTRGESVEKRQFLCGDEVRGGRAGTPVAPWPAGGAGTPVAPWPAGGTEAPVAPWPAGGTGTPVAPWRVAHEWVGRARTPAATRACASHAHLTIHARYSWRRASIGSKREARRAGTMPLIRPTAARMRVEAMRVPGAMIRRMSPAW